MSGREFWFALASIDGIGPMRIKRLLNRFGSVDKVFDAELSEIARIPLFNPLLATRILKARMRIAEFRRHIKWFKSRGIEVFCPEDEEYPEQLKAIPNAPAILCRKGNLSKVSQQSVAIVGTTKPTDDGILATLELATHLVEAGFTVVSGLAQGIDTSAHVGVVAANGRTIGVLGSDLFSIYPHENHILADQICENGAIFSEHPFTTPSTPANLIQRNRIISGLSMATIVVESDENGGAIRTAQFGMEQNRLVFACRWQKRHRLSEGPHRLIQQGAFPISPDNLAEIVEALKDPGGLRVESTEALATEASVEQMELF